MTHVRTRVFFVVGSLAATVVLGGAALVTLLPATLPPFGPADEPLTRLTALAAGVPTRIEVKDLAGLERTAWAQRAASGQYRAMGPPRVDALPVYLVRSDGTARAFIGIDPRNGCPLQTITVARGTYQPSALVFHDVCHGSLYDMNGERYGGPSPWTLDQLVVSVRDGIVYVDRAAVVPGRLVLP